jgi:hypothetical protein
MPITKPAPIHKNDHNKTTPITAIGNESSAVSTA